VTDEGGYLLVKGDQGLGNRILCLLSALLLARLTGRRLLVDWRDAAYANDGRDAFPSLLRSDLAAPLAELPDTDSVRPALWRGHLHESAQQLRRRLVRLPDTRPFLWQRFSVPLDTIDHREHVLVFTSYFEQIDALRPHLTGALAPLRGLATAAILDRLWTEHLSLAPALQTRVDEFRRTHFTRPTLGVHVRASDLRTRVRAIEAAAASALRREPGTRIFVATDNAEVRARYRTRFADVVATEKWYPPAGEPMHFHPAHPDATVGAGDALVDLHLLAACDRLIVDSRSSFARLAALRSRAAAGRVTDLHPGRLVPLALRRRLLRLTSEAEHWARRLTASFGRRGQDDGQSPIA